MKQIIIVAIAVGLGIWVYRMLQKNGKNGSKSTATGRFEGADVDSQTGDYLGPGARQGTVDFAIPGN